ncbi:MAG: methyl-accepting chemotaxis protein [Symbiobacteriaceae bacterium]|nr:methyl-accepting chemotaxis protein [Symbiobacteriaceae bacterium]
MLKRFMIVAIISFVCALALASSASYLIQTSDTNRAVEDKLSTLLEDVGRLIKTRADDLIAIRQEMDGVYLEKTRAVSEMIKLNPALIEDKEELLRIANLLNADEIHVVDAAGTLNWSTIDAYVGFSFVGNPQTEPFLAAITNPNFELAQDPQPNAAVGIYFQYIGVARYDQPGVVQIGMRPEKLEKALHQADPQVLLNQVTIDRSMRILLISGSDIVGDSSGKLTGTTLMAKGLSGVQAGSGSVNLDGKGIYIARNFGDYLVMAFITDVETYGARNSMLVTFLIANAAVLFFLVMTIGIWMNGSIIRPLGRMSTVLEVISTGDLELRVDEHNMPEFRLLSDSINAMIDSIETSLEDAEAMTKQLSSVVDSIETSASHMAVLLQDVHNNALNNDQHATDAGIASNTALENADIGNVKMSDMVIAVQAIDESSKDIAKVMRTIDDIAFQTNILALNAAVEAARAGDEGRGFAVVAEEVRNLATKSAAAAKQTEELISSSIQKANYGVRIAQETAVMIAEIVENIRKSATLMEIIVVSSQAQVGAVSQLREDMDSIRHSVSSTGADLRQTGPMTPRALQAPSRY